MASDEPAVPDVSEQELEQDANDLPVFDLGLGVVVESNNQFRFNQDGVYLARETAVLVRCTLVERVHGQVSATDDTPCSLIVFDFQFDQLRAKRHINEATISLVLHDVKVRGFAPSEKISFDPLAQNEERTKAKNLKGGASYIGSLEAEASDETKTTTETTQYATATGWTTYWPRPRHNDPSPHNCVKWFIKKNPGGKDGVPPHFRTAVLLERDEDQDEIRLEMEIASKADGWTEFEDSVLLRGGVPPGKLVIDTTLPPTNTLRTYADNETTELGGLDLRPFGVLSLGALQKNRFR